MRLCVSCGVGMLIFIITVIPQAVAKSPHSPYLRAHYVLMQDEGSNDFNNILWDDLGSTNNIPWNKIDILYISFARITPVQNVLLQTTDDSNPVTELNRLNQLIVSRNTLSPRTKLVLSLGGWCNSGNPTNTFDYLYTNDKIDINKVTIFAHNLVEYLKKYRLDGVDIDWESLESGSDFYTVARIIRTALDKIEQKYLLTIAPSAAVDGSYNNLSRIIDYVNLMSYGDVDLNTYYSYNFPASKLLGGIHTYEGDGAPDESNELINNKASVVKSKYWAGLFEYNLLNDMYFNKWRITNQISDDRYNKKTTLALSQALVLFIYFCHVFGQNR